SLPRSASLPGVTWHKPVICTFVGPTTGDPAITLNVAWIAPSRQQAHELLPGVLDGNSRPIPGGYLVYYGAFNGGFDAALIVAGRAIVKVTVPGHPEDARRLAPLIAARLRAVYGSD